MSDIFYVGLTVGFFVVAFLLVRFCDRIR